MSKYWYSSCERSTDFGSNAATGDVDATAGALTAAGTAASAMPAFSLPSARPALASALAPCRRT